MRRLLTILTALIILPAYGKPVPHAGPVTDGGPGVSITEKALAITGGTKSDTLYAAGVEIRGGDAGVGVESHVATATVATDGTAQLDMQARITVRSIWIVIDGKGGYTITPGPTMVRREMDLQGNPASSEADGQVRRLVLKKTAAFFFLGRPGAGMWTSLVFDGVNDDDHAVNHSLTAALQKMKPDAGTTAPPPDHLAPGDVLFIVDPATLEYGVMRQGR